MRVILRSYSGGQAEGYYIISQGRKNRMMGSDLELCMTEADRYYKRLDHVVPKD